MSANTGIISEWTYLCSLERKATNNAGTREGGARLSPAGWYATLGLLGVEFEFAARSWSWSLSISALVGGARYKAESAGMGSAWDWLVLAHGRLEEAIILRATSPCQPGGKRYCTVQILGMRIPQPRGHSFCADCI
jgi:hypothetical protein